MLPRQGLENAKDERLNQIRRAVMVHDSLTPLERFEGDEPCPCCVAELNFTEPHTKQFIESILCQARARKDELYEGGAYYPNAPKSDYFELAAMQGGEMVLQWVLDNWDFVWDRLEDF
jgi:hypothetical protein